MKTQAVVIPEAGRIELRTVELTPLGSDDVLVATLYTSISAGTERMLLSGRLPHPMLQFPVVPGYETVGRVIAAGGPAGEHLVDQTVFVGGSRGYVAVNGAWGGQAAQLVVPAQRVVPLGDLAPQAGTLIALAATALHGVDLLQLGADAQVLVLGQGPVGQMAARWAKSRNARVTAADQTTARLALSEADVVIDVEHTPLSNLDTRFDIIIEASGSMAALSTGLSVLAPGGTILLLGFYDMLQLPYMPLFLREARLLTAKEWSPGDPERARDFLQGSTTVGRLLTHTLPVTEVQQAYELALHDSSCLKLVLNWEV
ncbi:MAG: zinc-binding dehydrogenase [Herpetosiphonaceae bacterium]|nr:zinc-binding dehydrogenase [Herpetosiphonaceae bacterium]